MISANEAREKTEAVRNNSVKREAVRNNSVKRELERIEHEIKEAISKGDNNITLDGTISNLTENYLRQLGYEVYTDSQYNESYLTIKW